MIGRRCSKSALSDIKTLLWVTLPTPYYPPRFLMPSAAWTSFTNNLIDVTRTIESHAALNHAGKGRRGLGHLTRGGVLLLCAAWELYAECLLRESLAILVTRCETPASLPEPVQRTLGKKVKADKHELKALHLAGDGWRNVLRNYAGHETESLNSPNSSVVNPLYHAYLAIDQLSQHWSLGAGSVDTFVRVRGEVAHCGRESRYVKITELRAYLDAVRHTAMDTEGFVGDHLREITGGRRPWNRIV